MYKHLMVLFPILLIGCGEQNREVGNSELDQHVRTAQPTWEINELERKAKVRNLVNQLADDLPEARQAALDELKNKYIRGRDIAGLWAEIEQDDKTDSEAVLWDLLFQLDHESQWRLPNNVWISDLFKCAITWDQELKETGYEATVGYGPDDGLRLRIPFKFEYSAEVVNLILEVEPKILILDGGDSETISGNAFLVKLVDIMPDIKILGNKDGETKNITPPIVTE